MWEHSASFALETQFYLNLKFEKILHGYGLWYWLSRHAKCCLYSADHRFWEIFYA